MKFKMTARVAAPYHLRFCLSDFSEMSAMGNLQVSYRTVKRRSYVRYLLSYHRYSVPTYILRIHHTDYSFKTFQWLIIGGRRLIIT